MVICHPGMGWKNPDFRVALMIPDLLFADPKSPDRVKLELLPMVELRSPDRLRFAEVLDEVCCSTSSANITPDRRRLEVSDVEGCGFRLKLIDEGGLFGRTLGPAGGIVGALLCTHPATPSSQSAIQRHKYWECWEAATLNPVFLYRARALSLSTSIPMLYANFPTTCT